MQLVGEAQQSGKCRSCWQNICVFQDVERSTSQNESTNRKILAKDGKAREVGSVTATTTA